MVTLILGNVALCMPYTFLGGSGKKEHADHLEIMGMWVNLHI